MRAFVLRKRKVDATVVEGVFTELLQTPLAGPTDLVPRVDAQLGRDDLGVANIQMINDPFRTLQERANVKGKPEMADLLRPQAAAA
jgi:hypothetical protein